MARNLAMLSVLLGLVVASNVALAGEDLAFFVVKDDAHSVATENDWQGDVDLESLRGMGLEASAPTSNGGAGGQTAIILWDEVSKSRTQQGNGYSVGSSHQTTSITN
jgi:hypothetical protein